MKWGDVEMLKCREHSRGAMQRVQPLQTLYACGEEVHFRVNLHHCALCIVFGKDKVNRKYPSNHHINIK